MYQEYIYLDIIFYWIMTDTHSKNKYSQVSRNEALFTS